MKKMMVCAALLATAFGANAQAGKTKVKMKTTATVSAVAMPINPADSFSYAAGMSVAESMLQAGATNLNTKVFADAMNAVIKKQPAALTKDQANAVLQKNLQGFAKKRTDEQKSTGAAYLNTNRQRPGVIALPNGLQYEVIKAGDPNGVKPKAVDTVVVNYIGTLTDGTEFDNSVKRGQAAEFPLNGVIRGWTEILQLMTKGAHWKVYIPGDLAYGENPPQGAPIPPNAVLVFEITLEDIKPAKPLETH